MSDFSNLGLSSNLTKALTHCGYTKPTPIQQQAIPVALQGKDIIATSQTGSGKTAAFVLPILQRLEQGLCGSSKSSDAKGAPFALILTPTRELAQQITTVIAQYSKFTKIKAVNILGGMPYRLQMQQLAKHLDIIVATPGRLMDYMQRGKVNLSQIKVLVLDEADRMLDMGFIDAVEYIAAATPQGRQTLLFTATADERLVRLSRHILQQPEKITVTANKVTLDKIKQTIHIADNTEHKNRLLKHILKAQDLNKAIVFSATKRNADTLARQLTELGFKADALHGDMHQRKRNKTLDRLRDGRSCIIVATDVAARGIDIHDISHVINYDLPRLAEDYIHRIGRTGRAGRSGIAISLVEASDMIHLKRIERLTKQNIAQEHISGLEPKRCISLNKPATNFKAKKTSWSDKPWVKKQGPKTQARSVKKPEFFNRQKDRKTAERVY